ncbi:urea amidolyase family protein [Sinomonas halotolerans]|uniref:Urea amidolyase family protein n=1 Tax=Sinomonas halotolerans TaxID=1644133 RepID=A0ABU9WXY1_9MICC
MTGPGADIRWAGPRALLVGLAGQGAPGLPASGLPADALDAVLALHGRLLAEPLAGQTDAVAAAETVLVTFATAAHARNARAVLERLASSRTDAGERAASRHVAIEVVYDGEDLAEVGRLTGLGAEGVVAAHTGQVWTAAFGGFAPGFAYLVGEDSVLDVPRRTSPRTAVPAGSVALGGRFSAVYPRQSPGGWQLIGRTAAVMWDLDREHPALVRPGDTVSYTAVRESVSVREPAAAPARAAGAEPDAGRPALVVVSPGLQSLLEDLGRPGLGDLGVSAAGAADEPSARQANRLVGNPPGAAVIENLFGGLALRAVGDAVLAVTGAQTPLEVRAHDGGIRRPALNAPFALLDGEVLELGTPESGLRAYAAVRGGIDVPEVLGSRAADTMSGLGPAPLAAGTHLPVAEPSSAFAAVGAPEPPAVVVRPSQTLRVTLGPREDWFAPEALEALTGQEWTVTEQSNRIGVRLRPVGAGGSDGGEGRALERSRTGELASEGAVTGSLQVPPSGHPVLFLPDHPVTGGYPVIAVVVPEDLPLAAQTPPGGRLRFTVVGPTSTGVPSSASTSTEGNQP